MSPFTLLNDEVLTIRITKDAKGVAIPPRDMAKEAKEAAAAAKVKAGQETKDAKDAREAAEAADAKDKKEAKEAASDYTATAPAEALKAVMGADPKTGIPTVTLTPMTPIAMGVPLLIHDKEGELVDWAVINIVPRDTPKSLDLTKVATVTQDAPKAK